jgi:hypothetical protein
VERVVFKVVSFTSGAAFGADASNMKSALENFTRVKMKIAILMNIILFYTLHPCLFVYFLSITPLKI